MKVITLILFIWCTALATAEWNKLMEAGFYQGDMEISPSEVMQAKNSFGSTTDKLWPKRNGLVTIKYVIDGVNGARGEINRAIRDYERRTCIRFEEDNTPWIRRQPHIRFVPGDGCSSPVGRQIHSQGGLFVGNDIRLHHSATGSCWTKGTIIHEIMHTLGFHHEQSRPDRRNFVTINYGNIKRHPITGQDLSYNFDIENNIDSLGHAYDYRSIMHYDKKAFGGNDVTITTTDPTMQDVIGRGTEFSAGDIAEINE